MSEIGNDRSKAIETALGDSSPFLEVPLSELRGQSEGDESFPFLKVPLSETGDRSEAVEAGMGDDIRPEADVSADYFMSGGNGEGLGGFDEFSAGLDGLSGMDEPSFQL